MNLLFRALKTRNFALYAAATLFWTVGLWIQRLGIAWLTWTLTHSTFWLGLIAALQFVPTILLGPAFGVLVDRMDRHRGMIVTQLAMTAHAAALWAATASGLTTIWLLAIFAIVQGLLAAAVQPLRLAIVPALVEREDMGAAVALISTIFNLSRLLGPAVAGPVIAGWGVASAFALYAAMAIPTLVAFAAIRMGPAETRPPQAGGFFAQFTEGLRYAGGHKDIGRTLLLLGIVSILGRSALELLPAFADRVFGGGVVTLALFTSAAGLGAAIAGFWFAAQHGEKAGTRATVVCAFATPAALLGFVATSSIPVGMWLAGIAGLFGTGVAIGAQTTIQLAASESVRGRVMALYSALQVGGPAIGAMLLGALSETLDLRLVVAAATTASILLLLPIALKQPAP